MHLPVPCPRCGKLPPPPCGCVLPSAPAAPAPAAPKRKLRPEVAKLRREKRGSDREVVVVEGLPNFVDLEDLAREIKARCGTGGTVRGRTVEIQGDHRDAIAELLLARGFRSKRAGG